MQDLTSAQCTEEPTIVIDKRDEQIYTIRRIGDAGCWMVDNLRFGYNENNPDTTTLTLKPEDSNVSEERTITAYDLVTYGGGNKQCYGNYSDSDPSSVVGAGYTTPCIHSRDTENNIIGVWYNYAAITAGTIVAPGNSASIPDSTEDICPKGWRLSTSAEQTALIPYASSFAPADGGYYHNGDHYYLDRGVWAASTAYVGNGQRTYRIVYNSTDDYLAAGNTFRRNSAGYVRCTLQES